MLYADFQYKSDSFSSLATNAVYKSGALTLLESATWRYLFPVNFETHSYKIVVKATFAQGFGLKFVSTDSDSDANRDALSLNFSANNAVAEAMYTVTSWLANGFWDVEVRKGSNNQFLGEKHATFDAFAVNAFIFVQLSTIDSATAAVSSVVVEELSALPVCDDTVGGDVIGLPAYTGCRCTEPA